MQITECQFNPINFQIENNEFGLNQNFITQLEQRLLEVQFTTPNQRIQFELSSQIVQKLLNTYENFSINIIEIRCDDRFNYKYDGVFINEQSHIGLEIQFRPDFLKDITRFQLGYTSGRFQAIVYIVAIDRNTINDRYTTMPQFDDISEVLTQLEWFQIPVLLVGINCSQ
jgi:hypothetical protein